MTPRVAPAKRSPERDTDQAAFDQELVDGITERLVDLLNDVRAAGLQPASMGDPQELIDRMIASIPRSDPFNLELGPFYSTASLSKWMGVTRQYIRELVLQSRIIALTTSDNHLVYPAFQFGTKASTMPFMAEVRAVLANGTEPWAEAMWFVTPSKTLNDQTPAKYLLRGGKPGLAVLAAHQSMTIFAGQPVEVKDASTA